MEARIPSSSMSFLPLPPSPLNSTQPTTPDFDFNTVFSHLNSVLISPKSPKTQKSAINVSLPHFLSTSISTQLKLQNPEIPTSQNPLKTTLKTTLKNLSVFERAFIGACAGGSAGAFTYVFLYPLETVKTKLQTKGASQVYKNTLDAIVKTFETKGILGFYSGVSAVLVGSTFSSAVYFATCEFGKSLLSKFENYPPVLIPPTAGLMGNVVSSAIMVPKELITQRMQAGAKGRSWEVLLGILERDGVLGLYAGYSATLLRNLPAGVLSYSTFEWLKAAVQREKEREKLTPLESVCCGALAGAISASLTTPLDVVKTRLMVGEAVNKVAAATFTGVSATVKQILAEEGWVGFTRGMGPRVVHSACFSAIGYFAFETARLAIMEQYVKHKDQSKEEMIATTPL
ncbi:protein MITOFERRINLIKE 1, chloroplastic [Beta vulgaris subsp. vulgaris]|uniref:protein MITOFERRINLIKE 1, chloroplastic n=1 Tax=Beta vulgaris subsp. vulgaris TaxID=3555 RepID=UPI0020368F5D|nr:protein MITOFERRINLIKE 1, chloroplastic [Beta vulgaris subsp. vulgaris]XP_010680228.2 protein MITOFERRINLIKE 1, chloroplastic [Beta vulgaris subsp. vulgaris]XP_048499788.1 protein MITOFERRINLIKE 1, chloroplastic [Beta vulgaris subsp. vulgaris]